jgi:hypothetical protein
MLIVLFRRDDAVKYYGALLPIRLIFNICEIILFGAATRANPRLRQIAKLSAGLDPLPGIANRRIINKTAYRTNKH